jgi:dCTP deaminase
MRRGFKGELLDPFDITMVNPASIDIRVGRQIIDSKGVTWYPVDQQPYTLHPGEFVLVATYERLKVPLDCAMDLRLKSTLARRGLNHALAFWFDPGWDGIGTMELQNIGVQPIALQVGQRVAQIIYHQLTAPCEQPYQGRYQHARTVEGAKHVG